MIQKMLFLMRLNIQKPTKTVMFRLDRIQKSR